MKVGTDQALFPKSGESKGIQRPAYVKRLPPPADSRQQAQPRRHPSEKESRDAITSVFIVRSWDTDSNASPLNISFGLSESMQDEIPVNDRYSGCNFTGLCQSQVDVPVPTPEDESPGQGKDKTMRYEILACPPLPESSRTTQSAPIEPLKGTEHSADKNTLPPALQAKPPTDELETSLSTAVVSNSQLKASRNISSTKHERQASGSLSKHQKTTLKVLGLRSRKKTGSADDGKKHKKDKNLTHTRDSIETPSKGTAASELEPSAVIASSSKHGDQGPNMSKGSSINIPSESRKAELASENKSLSAIVEADPPSLGSDKVEIANDDTNQPSKATTVASQSQSNDRGDLFVDRQPVAVEGLSDSRQDAAQCTIPSPLGPETELSLTSFVGQSVTSLVGKYWKQEPTESDDIAVTASITNEQGLQSSPSACDDSPSEHDVIGVEENLNSSGKEANKDQTNQLLLAKNSDTIEQVIREEPVPTSGDESPGQGQGQDRFKKSRFLSRRKRRWSDRNSVTGPKVKACAVAKSLGKPVEIKPISFCRGNNKQPKTVVAVAEQKKVNASVKAIKSLGKPVQAKPLSFRKTKESESPQSTTGTLTIPVTSIVPSDISECRDLALGSTRKYNENVGPIKSFAKPVQLNPISVRKIQRNVASSAAAMIRRNKDKAILKTMAYLGTPLQAKPKTLRLLNKRAANTDTSSASSASSTFSTSSTSLASSFGGDELKKGSIDVNQAVRCGSNVEMGGVEVELCYTYTEPNKTEIDTQETVDSIADFSFADMFSAPLSDGDERKIGSFDVDQAVPQGSNVEMGDVEVELCYTESSKTELDTQETVESIAEFSLADMLSASSYGGDELKEGSIDVNEVVSQEGNVEMRDIEKNCSLENTVEIPSSISSSTERNDFGSSAGGIPSYCSPSSTIAKNDSLSSHTSCEKRRSELRRVSSLKPASSRSSAKKGSKSFDLRERVNNSSNFTPNSHPTE